LKIKKKKNQFKEIVRAFAPSIVVTSIKCFVLGIPKQRIP